MNLTTNTGFATGSRNENSKVSSVRKLQEIDENPRELHHGCQDSEHQGRVRDVPGALPSDTRPRRNEQAEYGSREEEQNDESADDDRKRILATAHHARVSSSGALHINARLFHSKVAPERSVEPVAATDVRNAKGRAGALDA
jgi:hypothetical protein